MPIVVPANLMPGDEVRVIAPALSMNMLSRSTTETATKRLHDMGLTVSFGQRVEKIDMRGSASIPDRLADLHEAFLDPNVKMVLTAIGGFNSNQLLDDIDYHLIQTNPKILCGYSDVTALATAIYAETGLVTYAGPHFSTFGMEKGIAYTLESFTRAFFHGDHRICASSEWSDDAWFLDQENRIFHENPGYRVIHEGRCSGVGLGGNLCTLNLLQGTRYMPSLQNAVLFLEDDELTSLEEFDRDLESLIQLPDFDGVQGILIGRFQLASEITLDDLQEVIRRKKKLRNLPIMANIDFGHTTPHCVLPIGASVSFDTDERAIHIGG